MKVRTALMAAAFLAASPLLAQTPPTSASPKAPARQAGTATTSTIAPTQAEKAAPATPAAPAEKVDPAKEAAIRHLLDVTQTSKMGDNLNAYVTNQVRQILSQAMPADRLSKLMDAFSQKLVTVVPASAVTDAAIPIYARAFSMEDIQAIIQFYESPVGQRVVKTLPQVGRESQELGVQMEQKAAMNILQEMSSDYPELKPMLRPQGNDPAPEPAAPAK